jgi:hypothetical protein
MHLLVLLGMGNETPIYLRRALVRRLMPLHADQSHYRKYVCAREAFARNEPLTIVVIHQNYAAVYEMKQNSNVH